MAKEIKMIVASDNHGGREQIEFLRNTYPKDWFYLHCGDSEMFPEELEGFATVRGNNDMMGFENSRVLDFGEHRIYLTHGHLDMYGLRLSMLADKAKKLGCDIVCFGHLHRCIDVEIEGVRILNPGSMWYNRDGNGPSYIILTLNGEKVEAEFMEWKPAVRRNY